MAMSTMLKAPIFRLINSKLKQFSNIRSFTFGRSKRLDKFYKRDGIPDKYSLIYRNPVTKYIEYAQMSSVAIGISMSAMLVYYLNTDMELDKRAYGPTNHRQILISTASVLSFCAVLQFICYKSPIRIYSDVKKFILVLNGPLGPILKPRKIEFDAGNCEKLLPNPMTLFQDARYQINGKVYIIFEHHFKSNADYNRMLGT